jgi:hypothetical protein
MTTYISRHTGATIAPTRPSVALTRAETEARQDAALRLHREGLTLRSIAGVLHYTVNENTDGRQTVRRAIKSALAREARRGTNRTFGVEMETVNLSRSHLAAIVGAALNLPHVHYTGYHGRTCEGCGGRLTDSLGNSTVKGTEWLVEYDGSLRSRNGRSGEVISRILKGEEGLQEVATVARALKAAGASTNRSTGLHVHVGASDLTADALILLVDTYHRAQDEINRIMPISRTRNSTYCAPYSQYEVEGMRTALMAGGTARDIAARYGTKYRVLNIQPLLTHGTVEYRQHGGSLNGTKISHWIRTVVGMTNAAAKGLDLIGGGNAPTLDGMLEALTNDNLIPATTRTAIRARAN